MALIYHFSRWLCGRTTAALFVLVLLARRNYYV